MTPQQFKEGVGAYVLGALDPEEARAYQAFLESGQADEECQAALERARRAADALSRSQPPVQPSPRVWEAIEAEVTLAPSNPQTGGEETSPGIVPILRTAFPWALAASLLLLTLLTQQQIAQMKGRLADLEVQSTQLEVELDETSSKADYLARLIELPGTQVVNMATSNGDAPIRAALIMHSGVKECAVVTSGMPAKPGKAYVVWFLKDGQPRNLGAMPIGERGMGVMPIEWSKMADHPETVAVTIEQDPKVEAPTSKPIMAGAI